ncbi:MAG: cell filamentation protein Fic [Prevotellaceae bacterium]|jgi:hypothetical protein|nr:cell filamentation protein Fic [Prevotellaceae bacterium]
MEENKIIIYNTDDGKNSVNLYAKDGTVWLNQQLMAELFDTSKQNISLHIINVFEDNELDANSVVKDYLTTAADGKQYSVTFYSLDMILAVGFRFYFLPQRTQSIRKARSVLCAFIFAPFAVNFLLKTVKLEYYGNKLLTFNKTV